MLVENAEESRTSNLMEVQMWHGQTLLPTDRGWIGSGCLWGFSLVSAVPCTAIGLGHFIPRLLNFDTPHGPYFWGY
jgi:hypothetical protein